MLAFWLAIFARIAPIVAIHPVFGGRSVPPPVTVTIAAALACAVFAARDAGVQTAISPSTIVWQCAIGTTIGIIGLVVVGVVEAAGRLADDARGASAAHYYVPQLDVHASPLAQLDALAAVAVFWVAGMHRLLFGAVFDSFDALPLGPDAQWPVHGASFLALLTTVTMELARTGILLAGPALATGLVADAVLAFVNRASPQMNAFFLGFPVKLLAVVGITALGTNGRAAIWTGLWSSHVDWLKALWGH